MKIMEEIDAEVLDTMEAHAAAKDSQVKSKEPGKDGKPQNSEAEQLKAQQSSEKLQLKLQQLMERRKQMFDLMTNMSQKFNEMAKAAIQNMARA
jgi:hypothetical protein